MRTFTYVFLALMLIVAGLLVGTFIDMHSHAPCIARYKQDRSISEWAGTLHREQGIVICEVDRRTKP